MSWHQVTRQIAILEKLLTASCRREKRQVIVGDSYITGARSDNPYLLAGDPTTPLELLAGLMTEDNHCIRLHVAENPSIPAACLAELANDVSPDVRISVAEHPSTPLAVLEMLAEDDHPDVRFAIAENANMPPHILRILSQDRNPYVTQRATKTLERIKSAVRPKAPGMLTLPKRLLHQLEQPLPSEMRIQ